MSFIAQLFLRFLHLFIAPFKSAKVFWIALPLLATAFIVEIYFAKYPDEELGWNTALANALVLIFSALNIFQYIFSSPAKLLNLILTSDFLLGIIIFIFGSGLLLLDFFHKLPDKIAFIISAHLPMNLSAYAAIVIIYDKLPINLLTICACVLYVVFHALVFFILRRVMGKKNHSQQKYNANPSQEKMFSNL